MSLKLIIVCALVAVVSCANIDQDQLNHQIRQHEELVRQQSEQIREHHRAEIEQRQAQLDDLEDQRRHQEQLIRDEQQQRRDNIHEIRNIFITAQPHSIPAPIHFIAIPSSRRNFNVHDDSNYNFNYAVSDLTTGDMKSQKEVRRGDQVQGQYTMMDSDGYRRIVNYTADDKNGFDAEVRREPVSFYTTPQFVRIDGPNNYAAHFYHEHQPTAFVAHPTIYASSSVSRNDNGQRNQYSSSTASNF